MGFLLVLEECAGVDEGAREASGGLAEEWP